MSCCNNLKQICLALHNYHDTFKSLPPGAIPSNRFPGDLSSWSWHVFLMPTLEQGTAHDALQPNQPQSLREALADPVKVTVLTTSIPSFICPSDTGNHLNDDRRLDPSGLNIAVSKTNYVGCMGVDNSSPADGLFYFRSNHQLRDILDGPSNTFAVGERATLPIQGTSKPGAGIWAGATTFPCAGGLPNDCTIGVYSNVSFQMQSGIGAVPATLASWGYSEVGHAVLDLVRL